MNRIDNVGTLVSVATGATGRIKTPTRHGSMHYAAAQKEHTSRKAETNVAIMERGDNQPKTETSAPEPAPVITPVPSSAADSRMSLEGVLALVMADLFPHFDGTAVDAVKEMAAWITTAREDATRRQLAYERVEEERDALLTKFAETKEQLTTAEDEIRSLVHELEDVRAAIVPALPVGELPMARVHISITVAAGGTLNVYGGTS